MKDKLDDNELAQFSRQKRWRLKNPEKHKEYQQKWLKSEKGRASRAKTMRKYMAKLREKV